MWVIIWRGWGFLTVIIFVAVLIVAIAVSSMFFDKNAPLSQVGRVALPASLFLAAAANWVVGRRLNGHPPRKLFDPKTGQSVLLKSRHTLFFVKMEYWSVPAVLLGVGVLAAVLFSGLK
jgi:hypothetical protein